MAAAQVCPHCRSTVETTSAQTACPRCGKPLTAPAVSPAGARWYYAHNKQRKGPLALAQLRALAAAGEIQPATMVLQEGSQRWMTAGELPGVFTPAAPVSPPPAPPAAAVEEEEVWVLDEPARSPRPQSQSKGERLARGLASSRAALRDFTVGSAREGARRLKSAALRRQLAGLRTELNERLPAEVGSHLLSEGVSLTGNEELVERHRSLSRSFSLASQAALAGDRSKKKETRDIARQLQEVYVEYGRRALQQPAPFPGRQQYQERQQQLAEQIRVRESEQAQLQAQWQATSARSKRWVVAGWCLAAVLPLVLLGVVLKGVFWRGTSTSPAGLVQADPPEVAQEKAQAVLVAAEGRVWNLQGDALREAQAILESAPQEEAPAGDPEKRLRDLLRARRSKTSLEKARTFAASLSSGSRQFLEQTARGLNMQPEDFVLEWLTYEGALSLGLLTQAWHDQDSLKKEGGQLISEIFEGVSEPPAATKGVQVHRADNRIDVSLFGAHVTETIDAARPASVQGDEVVLWWKSSSSGLRELVRGDPPTGLSKKTISAEEGRYAIDYQGRLEAYLSGGHRQPWATSLHEEALGTLVEAAEGTKGGTSRKSLQQLFTRLSPSVPIVEATGSSFGSGFLVSQRGKYLVVTNRHVIENASDGVAVRFLKARGSDEEELTIPASQATIVAIHHKADLAVVDVTPAAARIRGWGVRPVTLAPRRYTPPVGAHVFAIGHPGGGGTLLTRTLSDGIVSATGREAEEARYLQVTVPLNPGNSGGPLFDDEGRVVGVNTFVLRKNEDRETALEALNFALEVSYVHELLTDPSKSLDEKAIAAVLHPPADALEKAALTAAIKKMAQTWIGRGYQPYGGSVKRGVRVCQVPAHTKSVFTIALTRGRGYGVAVVSEGARELNLAMLNNKGVVVASDSKPHSDPSIRFQARSEGVHSLVISNPSKKEALVVVAVFEK